MARASPQPHMSRAGQLLFTRAAVPAQQHPTWMLQASF